MCLRINFLCSLALSCFAAPGLFDGSASHILCLATTLQFYLFGIQFHDDRFSKLDLLPAPLAVIPTGLSLSLFLSFSYFLSL